MSCISCSVPLWCSSICFMAQASTHLCFHGEIKVVGAPVPAVQSLSTLVSLHLHHVLILPFISPLSCHSCLSFPLFFFLIIFYSHLWLSLPLSLSLISSCPLSLSLSHPFCSAVKASSRVFQKIKTLSPSLCIYRSVPPALSITLQMLHWMFPSPRSNRSDSKPVFSLLSTAACESAWHRFFFSFILLFVFLCMRIREPCWRDYSLLWELWRSPNVIICSTSSCVFGRNEVGLGLVQCFTFSFVGEVVVLNTAFCSLKFAQPDVLTVWKFEPHAHTFEVSDAWSKGCCKRCVVWLILQLWWCSLCDWKEILLLF